jgi:hypothetical protein
MMQNGRHAALGAITWALLTGGLAAQAGTPAAPAGTPPKENQLNPGSIQPGGGKPLVIGCLSREGDATAPTFVLSESRGKPPARYHLTGDVDLLRVHVGHTIEVGGPITAAPPAPGATPGPPTLTVESLAYIAQTCLTYP